MEMTSEKANKMLLLAYVDEDSISPSALGPTYVRMLLNGCRDMVQNFSCVAHPWPWLLNLAFPCFCTFMPSL